MNIFSVGDGNTDGYELTRETFMEKTHKSFPFYQNPNRYKTPHFAICPACNNPIQIINLLGVQYEEENTGRTNLHGRHYKNDVKGLPPYSEVNYENCPLHNPVAFRIRMVRNNEQLNEEIRAIVENSRSQIYADIREITGVLLSNKKLDQVINDYIVARDYCYTHTNKFNIPYSILYTREAINIFGQKVDGTDIGQRIYNTIQNNCAYFEFVDGRIQKNIDDYVELNLNVANHRIRGSKQYMTIRIEEKKREEIQTIFEEEIEMKQYVY